MVHKQRIALIVWFIFLRIVFLSLLLYIGAIISNIALDILKDYLGYHAPEGIFDINFSDLFISFDLALVFLSGIFFGALGRKSDYIFIFLIFAQAIWEYLGTPTFTFYMGVGLLVALISGNAIGFSLKLFRQKFLPKLKV
jgi:hypothetical protein